MSHVQGFEIHENIIPRKFGAIRYSCLPTAPCQCMHVLCFTVSKAKIKAYYIVHGWEMMQIPLRFYEECPVKCVGLNNTDWDSLLTDSTNSSWKNWHSMFMEIMHNSIPQVTAKSKKSLPWINKQIVQTIAKWNACYRLSKLTQCNSALLKYKSLRNKVVGLVREARRKYFENINSLNDQKYFGKLSRC